MKKNYSSTYSLLLLALLTWFASCRKFEADVLPMNPIDVGSVDSYASLEENSYLSIPVRYTSMSDSGISKAGYKVVNRRAGIVTTVSQSPLIEIPFEGQIIDTTLKVPVRQGLVSVVVIVYDKGGRMSSKSIDVKEVVPSTGQVKTYTDLVMSTDPADNQNFFSMYEANPVFGAAEALTKQERIDFIMVNMNGARIISPNAYGAGANYYNASKEILAGFTTLSYSFFTSSRTYINQANFDAITTESQLTTFLNDTVMAIPPNGGANYNIVAADRRVSDVFGVSSATKGLIMGWGYRSHPAGPTAVLNESFALILVKNVTKKPNGHFVATLDIKAPSFDQRESYSATPIAPYDPYPL